MILVILIHLTILVYLVILVNLGKMAYESGTSDDFSNFMIWANLLNLLIVGNLLIRRIFVILMNLVIT